MRHTSIQICFHIKTAFTKFLWYVMVNIFIHVSVKHFYLSSVVTLCGFYQTLMNVFWAPTPVTKRAPIQTETTRASVTVATTWSGSLLVKVQSRCFSISLLLHFIMHRSTAGYNTFNLSPLTIDYSKTFTTSYLLTI